MSPDVAIGFVFGVAVGVVAVILCRALGLMQRAEDREALDE